MAGQRCLNFDAPVLGKYCEGLRSWRRVAGSSPIHGEGPPFGFASVLSTYRAPQASSLGKVTRQLPIGSGCGSRGRRQCASTGARETFVEIEDPPL